MPNVTVNISKHVFFLEDTTRAHGNHFQQLYLSFLTSQRDAQA